jgi:hypothetical protein
MGRNRRLYRTAAGAGDARVDASGVDVSRDEVSRDEVSRDEVVAGVNCTG